MSATTSTSSTTTTSSTAATATGGPNPAALFSSDAYAPSSSSAYSAYGKKEGMQACSNTTSSLPNVLNSSRGGTSASGAMNATGSGVVGSEEQGAEVGGGGGRAVPTTAPRVGRKRWATRSSRALSPSLRFVVSNGCASGAGTLREELMKTAESLKPMFDAARTTGTEQGAVPGTANFGGGLLSTGMTANRTGGNFDNGYKNMAGDMARTGDLRKNAGSSTIDCGEVTQFLGEAVKNLGEDIQLEPSVIYPALENTSRANGMESAIADGSAMFIAPLKMETLGELGSCDSKPCDANSSNLFSVHNVSSVSLKEHPSGIPVPSAEKSTAAKPIVANKMKNSTLKNPTQMPKIGIKPKPVTSAAHSSKARPTTKPIQVTNRRNHLVPTSSTGSLPFGKSRIAGLRQSSTTGSKPPAKSTTKPSTSTTGTTAAVSKRKTTPYHNKLYQPPGKKARVEVQLKKPVSEAKKPIVEQAKKPAPKLSRPPNTEATPLSRQPTAEVTLKEKIRTLEKSLVERDDRLRVNKEHAGTLESKLRDHMALLESKLAALTADLDSARSSLKEKDVELRAAAKSKRELEEKYDRQTLVLGEKEQAIESLNTALQHLKEQYAEQAKHHSEELETLTTAHQSEMTHTIEQHNQEIECIKQQQKRELEACSARYTAEIEERHKLHTEKTLQWERTRRSMHNRIQDLEGNIRVVCRIRKVQENEIPIQFSIPAGNEELQVLKPLQNLKGETRLEPVNFKFDYVLAPTTSQEIVFQNVASDFIQSVLDGYNCCLFAYGQTGSGKTYTMEGPPEVFIRSKTDLPSSIWLQRGIIPRAMDQIFGCIATLSPYGWDFHLYVSIAEIYMDKVRDLTKRVVPPQTPEHKTLKPDIASVEVSSPEQVFELLRAAYQNRAQAPTAVNAHSSRSHCIFQLKIVANNAVSHESYESTLNLIDLAGCERLDESEVVGKQKEEAATINASLSHLITVISAIKNNAKYVPFADCMLTRYLKNFLTGTAKVLMIVAVSPTQKDLHHTLNALQFASQVQKAHVGPQKSKPVLNSSGSENSANSPTLSTSNTQSARNLATLKPGTVKPKGGRT
ncbi:carboxy-terminal kinesin 2 [Pelomyxa schiedti]|nr:carboxy-terminal kinesin 2 [Pelomyxa schiedti]